MRIIGYGICGKEADRYLEATLKEFKRLCDDTIIVLNNATDKEKNLIESYGFKTKVDNRTWGLEQHHIKQDLMEDVKALKPDYCVCLDMDEVFDPAMDRARLLEAFEYGNALYFYIVNLWNEGWNRKWSFWNIRAWKWSDDTKFENKPLHCGLAPAWCYRLTNIHVPLFVKHYGLMKKEDRQKKIERYQQFDPQAKYKDVSYYNALSIDTCDPLNEQDIRDAIVKEIGIQAKKSKPNIKPAKMYYVKRKDGKIIDIPAQDLKETLSRGFTYVGEVGI